MQFPRDIRVAVCLSTSGTGRSLGESRVQALLHDKGRSRVTGGSRRLRDGSAPLEGFHLASSGETAGATVKNDFPSLRVPRSFRPGHVFNEPGPDGRPAVRHDHAGTRATAWGEKEMTADERALQGTATPLNQEARNSSRSPCLRACSVPLCVCSQTGSARPVAPTACAAQGAGGWPCSGGGASKSGNHIPFCVHWHGGRRPWRAAFQSRCGALHHRPAAVRVASGWPHNRRDSAHPAAGTACHQR